MFPYVSYALVAAILAVLVLMATQPDLREQVGLCALLFVVALVGYHLRAVFNRPSAADQITIP